MKGYNFIYPKVSLMIEANVQSNITKKEMLELGFEFKIADTNNISYEQCILPNGWKIEDTKLKKKKELVDEHGRTRADVYLKGNKHIIGTQVIFKTRFNIARHPNYRHKSVHFFDDGFVYKGRCFAHVNKFSLSVIEKDDESWEQALERAISEVEEWAEIEYPKYQNPLAYWD